MPGESGWTCGDYARVLFYFAHEAVGAAGTRHSLRPLLSRVLYATTRVLSARREGGGLAAGLSWPNNSLTLLMRSASSRVSNHEPPRSILRDAARSQAYAGYVHLPAWAAALDEVGLARRNISPLAKAAPAGQEICRNKKRQGRTI